MASNGRRSLTVVNSTPPLPGTRTVRDIGGSPVVPGENSNINRHDFPEGFIFGMGTSSYQVEGAAFTGGKALSTWDEFTLRTPARIEDGQNGNIACDMYNRYKEDVRRMKNMGFEAYRFSISWQRILPGGRASAGVNREGIDYYNDLIDTIIANGMKPYVTLFHWDFPLVLEKEYGGFLSKKVVPDFLEYAEICFFEFGDRVQWWTTINEPWTYAVNGYVRGTFPPSHLATIDERVMKQGIAYRGPQVPKGVNLQSLRSLSDSRSIGSDPARDGYTVARNLLLAHSEAVNLYRTKFQPHHKGEIGIVLNSHWFVPYDPNSQEDKEAAHRAVDFMLGWFLEPCLYGRYPESMTEFVPPENLISFTASEASLLKGSLDFVGFNYYTTNYAQYNPNPTGEGYDADMRVTFHTEKDGVPIGDASGSYWLFIVPWGIYDHLHYFKSNYPDLPPMYITENGVSDRNDFRLTAKEACVDTTRVKFYQDHLANILQAMKDADIDIKGYIAWSYCDNFEWAEGYTGRFGIVYVDFINNLTRHPKNSAMWFIKFLQWDKDEMPTSNKHKRLVEEETGLTVTNGSNKRLKGA